MLIIRTTTDNSISEYPFFIDFISYFLVLPRYFFQLEKLSCQVSVLILSFPAVYLLFLASRNLFGLCVFPNVFGLFLWSLSAAPI